MPRPKLPQLAPLLLLTALSCGAPVDSAAVNDDIDELTRLRIEVEHYRLSARKSNELHKRYYVKWTQCEERYESEGEEHE